MICICDLRILLKIFQSNANFLKESHIQRALLAPGLLTNGLGPGLSMSPSPNARPRTLGWSRAWALTNH